MSQFSEKELEAINNAKDVLKGLKSKICKLDSLNDQISSIKENFRYYSSPQFNHNNGSGSKPHPVCDMVSKIVSFTMDRIAELNAEMEEIEKEMQIVLKAISYMPTAIYQQWIARVHIGGQSWRSLTSNYDRMVRVRKAYLEFWNTYTQLKDEM